MAIKFLSVFFLLLSLACKKSIPYQINCRVCKKIIQTGSLTGTIENHLDFTYNPVAKIAYRDTVCNACLNEEITIRVGEMTRCPVCGKILADSTELIALKRIDSIELFPRPIKILQGQSCSRRCKIKWLHPDWSEAICKIIVDKKIVFGTTRSQVLESWGPPGNIKRIVTPDRVTERWIYKDYILYFEKDSLVRWED